MAEKQHRRSSIASSLQVLGKSTFGGNQAWENNEDKDNPAWSDHQQTSHTCSINVTTSMPRSNPIRFHLLENESHHPTTTELTSPTAMFPCLCLQNSINTNTDMRPESRKSWAPAASPPRDQKKKARVGLGVSNCEHRACPRLRRAVRQRRNPDPGFFRRRSTRRPSSRNQESRHPRNLQTGVFILTRYIKRKGGGASFRHWEGDIQA